MIGMKEMYSCPPKGDNYVFLSWQSYIFFSRTINIIIITNIIEVITIKMMLLTIFILPCDYTHKY